MKAPSPSLSDTFHHTSYDAMSPTRPELSVANKTVIVTGGGRGIGPEIAIAYAAAGASHVVLIGRTQTSLSQTAADIEKEFPSVWVTTHTADIADENAIGKAAEGVGRWDVLILNAGLAAEPQSIEKSDTVDWWRVFETNVKGAMLTTRAFLPFRNKDASIIGVSTNLITDPVSGPVAIGASAYTCSKIAQVRLLEYVSAENPDLFVVSVHPGIVDTDMLRFSGLYAKLYPSFLNDGVALLFIFQGRWTENLVVSLSAHFILWLASTEARFLKGKYVCAQWDVEELKARAKEIEMTRILEANIHGWPYGGAMDAMLAHKDVES